MAKDCDKTFTSKDGKDSVDCGKTGPHVVHKDPKSGKTALRVPGGALITERHGEGYVVKGAERR